MMGKCSDCRFLSSVWKCKISGYPKDENSSCSTHYRSRLCPDCGTRLQHIPDLGQTWLFCPECKPEHLENKSGGL